MHESSTQKELRRLLRACRQLMREILTVSAAERSSEWISFLSAATRQVEEATRCVQDFDQRDSSTGEVERLANNLARLYVQDMLAREEQRFASSGDQKQGREGFQGFTWAISIPDLLSFLQMQGKTGVLRINIGTEVISLALQEGDLVNAFSDNSPPGLRLGEILVRQGRIEMERLERFLSGFEFGKEPLGEALERAGLIQHDELEEALEFQIRLIFVRLLCSEKAHFRFETGAPPASLPSRYSIMQLLLDACRIHDEARSSHPITPALREDPAG
jgi:hypothetical protein